MKIVLFTIWHVKNYGAEMQAYATIRALTELGHEVIIADLRLSDMRIMTPKIRFATMIERCSPSHRQFETFWAFYFPNRIRYTSVQGLKKNPPEADMYLVGSDQTWNIDITKTLFPVFLLDFGSNEVKRASYASSFGNNVWNGDSNLTADTKHALSKFDYLSCREMTGCDILKNVFDLDSTNVIDPTLLHYNYDELIGTVKEQNTLAYYPLDTDPELESYALKLAKIMKLIPVNINDKQRIIGSLVWNRTPIQKWIRSIAEAKFVLTRSFHGLAFSLIYQRQFAIVNNSNRSSRLLDLLKSLGLENRMFSSMEEMIQSRIWEEKIDYNIVKPKLDVLRKASWNYLKQLK